jgi:hypothetical protein
MTAAKALRTLLHWVTRHLVALGVLAFVVVGWFWREQVLPDAASWHGLTVLLRDSEQIDDVRQNEIPKGVFRPAVPMTYSLGLESGDGARLKHARKAFWLDRHVEAEHLYREYLAEHPDGVDGHGELGNLLFTLGRDSEARLEYLETARLLERQGRASEATQLRELLANWPRANATSNDKNLYDAEHLSQ